MHRIVFPHSARLLLCWVVLLFGWSHASADDAQPPLSNQSAERLLRKYCLDCHRGADAAAGLDIASKFPSSLPTTLIFENLATHKMPPVAEAHPTASERNSLLRWLAAKEPPNNPTSFRRVSRREFVHSINDLLGANLQLAEQIPDDRGTRSFETDRRIQLSREVLGSYFQMADVMLDAAFPPQGIPNEQTWITSTLKASHPSYRIYTRDYKDGTLFSWTRANNGDSYSFFYDHFVPPVSGWYELTFDAAKVGDFKEHVSIQVHAGRYYFADDRPQPQRLLDVISLGNRELKEHTTRVYLNAGEDISVHCYSQHNWRQRSPKQGAYIRQLKARGPVYNDWPPKPYRTVFGDLPIDAPDRESTAAIDSRTNLQRIGGAMTVSSFQKGMEKEKMQDGSNTTFWHTRFSPTLAAPPHFVILQNPRQERIAGLSYSTWTGGNGNGQVKRYAVLLSEDGKTWGEPVVSGELETRLPNEQPIRLPTPTTKPFLKFLILDAKTLDGRSLASIGRLDVTTPGQLCVGRTKIEVDVRGPKAGQAQGASDAHQKHLAETITRFAERAFSTQHRPEEIQPYIEVAQQSLREHGDFVRATKVALKAVVCSPRFLMAPGEHSSPAHMQASWLARTLWRSVPDAELLQLADSSPQKRLSDRQLQAQIERMLRDPRSERMIESLCDQWLNLQSWNKVSPSLKLYPKYDDLLHYYLPIETKTYLAHLVRENKPVSHLVDSNYTFLNQRLARHYGVAGIIGQSIRKVEFDPDSPRGGLLTMGSILKVTTDGLDTSPILRGAWVSKNIVGTPLSPPPASVEAIEPEHGRAAKTLREQIEQHKQHANCYACHKSIDPYGFALENFDATGQWRDVYRVAQPHRGTFQFRLEGYFRRGGEIDAAGEVNEQTFDDIFGLKKLLRNDHHRLGYNFAKRLFEFANGRTPSLKERIALLDMLDDSSASCRDLMTRVFIDSIHRESRLLTNHGAKEEP